MTVPNFPGDSENTVGEVPATPSAGTLSSSWIQLARNRRPGTYSPKGTRCIFTYRAARVPSGRMNRLSLLNLGPGASTLAPTTKEAPIARMDRRRGPAREAVVSGSLSKELSGHTTRPIFRPARVRVRASSLLSDCYWAEPCPGA